MAEEVDYEARKDSQKALCVILILAIIAATSYFFYMFLDRQFRFFYNTRKFIIVILTWGDLFIAIFSLFVRARQIYERRYRPGCSTMMCAQVYYMYYFPFVYATGLICLCVERIFRQRIRAFFRKPEFCSVAVAGIPWLLGLILILPLTLAGMDWDDCSYDSDSKSESRERAKIWISVVLPSTVAVICCIIAKQVKFDMRSVGRFTDPNVQATSGAQNPAPGPEKSIQMEGADVHNGVDQPEPNVYAYGNAPSQPVTHGVDLAEPNIYTYGNAPSQPVPNPQPNQAPPSSTYTSLAGEHPVPNSNQYVLETLVEKEKTNDLLVAVLFFVFTVPYALFYLGYYLNDDVEPLDPVPLAVLNDLFFWMLFARSVVLPIFWARVTSHMI